MICLLVLDGIYNNQNQTLIFLSQFPENTVLTDNKSHKGSYDRGM